MNGFPLYGNSQPDPPNPDEQLYRAIRNWAEFGIWLSVGILATFTAREVPALRSVYCLVAAGVLLFSRFARREEHGFTAIILLAIGIALLGGTWDYAWDVFCWLLSWLK